MLYTSVSKKMFTEVWSMDYKDLLEILDESPTDKNKHKYKGCHVIWSQVNTICYLLH